MIVKEEDKYVTIKPVFNSVIPEVVQQGSVPRIGSLLNSTTGDVHTGLADTEIKTLMPELVSLDASDPSFGKAVKMWFADIEVRVPYEGTRLNITIGKDNKPVNVTDYVKWKYSLSMPYVAKDAFEANTNSRQYKFYIVDENEEIKKELDKSELEDKAVLAYARLAQFTKPKEGASKEEIDKVNASNNNKIQKLSWVAKATVDIHGKGVDGVEVDTLKLIVRDVMKKEPAKFIEILNDSNLENNAFILDCIRYGMVEVHGTAIWCEGEELAPTQKLAAEKLFLPENSATLLKLKAKLREAHKGEKVEV